jgi:hypothetical protein
MSPKQSNQIHWRKSKNRLFVKKLALRQPTRNSAIVSPVTTQQRSTGDDAVLWFCTPESWLVSDTIDDESTSIASIHDSSPTLEIGAKIFAKSHSYNFWKRFLSWFWERGRRRWEMKVMGFERERGQRRWEEVSGEDEREEERKKEKRNKIRKRKNNKIR